METSLKTCKVDSTTILQHPFYDVMCQMCDELVVEEFQGLPQAAQMRMLDSFTSAMQSRCMHAVAAAQQAEQAGGEHIEVVDPTCPLFKALSAKVRDPSLLSGHILSELREDVIPAWGVAMPWPDLATRHNMQREHVRRELARNRYTQSSSDKTVQKVSGDSSHDWSTLRRIPIASLCLFETARGCVLEGSLIVEPTVQVGVATYLQDAAGDRVHLGLYGQLPGGASGIGSLQLAEATFPKGTRVAIAEPFLKIYVDGNRGVRVDDPRDLRVLENAYTGGESLQEARSRGNAASSRQEHAAAIEIYLSGLRSSTTEDISVLLANRSQAALKMERWADALCDAAAVLLMRPKHAKAWARYAAALDGLGYVEVAERARAVANGSFSAESPKSRDSVREVLTAIISASMENLYESVSSGQNAAFRKSDANEMFKKGDYHGAFNGYSSVLASADATELVHAIFANLAQSCLQEGQYHNTLSFALACLRLGSKLRVKAIYLLSKAFAFLCEPTLALQFLTATFNDHAPGANDDQLSQLSRDLKNVATRMATGYSSVDVVPSEVAKRHEMDTIDWAGPLEVTRIEGKGRGLKATREILVGEVFLVQRSFCTVSNTSTEQSTALSFDWQAKKMEDPTKVVLSSRLAQSARSDMVLGWCISQLSDGSSENLDVVPLDMLLQRLHPWVMPLLSQHPEYWSSACRPDIARHRVDRVVDINCHGLSQVEFETFFGETLKVRKGDNRESRMLEKLMGGCTNLYPAIAMINHSAKPNSQLSLVSICPHACGVIALHAIQPGEEITVSYLDDEDVVREKWKLTQSPS